MVNSDKEGNNMKISVSEEVVVRKVNGKTVKIFSSSDKAKLIKVKALSASDLVMDSRASCAIKAAVEKAKVCNKPIARYDIDSHKAYMELANGERKYAK
jgi:hypothetical protein